MKDFYIPEINSNLLDIDVWKWYKNIFLETKRDYLSIDEKNYLEEYYYSAGLLKVWRRPYFREHFSRPFKDACNFLFRNQSNPKILDLGGGFGTQDLLFAINGAEVYVVDIDELALNIHKKRKKFYEDQIQRDIKIHFIQKDAFSVSYKDLGPFDGLYSLFAFNMMQPSSRLLEKILPNMSEDSKFVIQDGNKSSILSQLLPSRRRDVLSPQELAIILESYGFQNVDIQGCIVMPPIMWFIFPERVLRKVDYYFREKMNYPISYILKSEKTFNQ